MSNGNTNLTDAERLIRIEMILDRIEIGLSKTVTQAECAHRHPIKKPLLDRVQQWGQIIILAAAMVGGYLHMQGLEARITSKPPTQMVYIQAPKSTPPPLDAGQR